MCAQPFCNVREIGTEYDNSEYQLEDWETCCVELPCHFALDIVFAFTA